MYTKAQVAALPGHRIVVSYGWQRHTAKHGCVFSEAATSCSPVHLEHLLDPNATTRRNGRVEPRHCGTVIRALVHGDVTVYTDLADFKHPLLLHPAHPMRERTLRSPEPLFSRPAGFPVN